MNENQIDELKDVLERGELLDVIRESDLDETIASLREGFCANTGKPPEAWVPRCIEIIRDRLRRNPLNYRRYGMYWWAVKRLIEADDEHPYAPVNPAAKPIFFYDDAGIRRLTEHGIRVVYGNFAKPEAVIAASEMFWENYLSSYFDGTREFTCDENGNSYALYDEKYEDAAENGGFFR